MVMDDHEAGIDKTKGEEQVHCGCQSSIAVLLPFIFRKCLHEVLHRKVGGQA